MSDLVQSPVSSYLHQRAGYCPATKVRDNLVYRCRGAVFAMHLPHQQVMRQDTNQSGHATQKIVPRCMILKGNSLYDKSYFCKGLISCPGSYMYSILNLLCCLCVKRQQASWWQKLLTHALSYKLHNLPIFRFTKTIHTIFLFSENENTQSFLVKIARNLSIKQFSVRIA